VKKKERRYRLCWRLIPHKAKEDAEQDYLEEKPMGWGSFDVDPPELDLRGRWYSYLEWLEPPIKDEKHNYSKAG
jgi:hypothetical protein